jgi:anti-sigma factor RsiW
MSISQNPKISSDDDFELIQAMFAKLSEYIDNEPDEPTRKEIEAHAAHCIPCLACLETLRQTIGLSRSLASEEIPVPETLRRARQSDFLLSNQLFTIR